MKRWLYALVALATLLPRLDAQVTVELLMDRDQYLPHEALPVGVRISNLSGQTLRFGTNTDWLRFTVEGFDGLAADQLAELPRLPEFTLASSKRVTKIVDLAPHFSCVTPGRYRVTAILNIPDYEPVVTSPQRSFDIVTGARLWEQIFGLPPKLIVAGQPAARKFILLKLTSMKDLRLYVRLTDPDEAQSMKVYQLCPMVSFSQPEAQIDKEANLHVLCQTGARSFLYQVLSSDCELVRRMTYEYAGSRPSLLTDGEGSFRVTGGVRRPMASDYSPTPDRPVVKVVTPAPETNAPAEKKKKKKSEK